MTTFCFVILHYIIEKETIQCVDSILKLTDKNINIVIVDNASKNNSGEKLKRHYISNHKVHVILNKENLGFSKGNNVGYRYAKNQLNADFIILCNNDIIVNDKNIIQKILEDYKKYSFGVLGPHITNLNKEEKNQNPVYDVMKTRQQMERSLEREIYIYKLSMLLVNINLDEKFLKLKDIIKRNISDTYNVNDNNEMIKNVGLHGCFWILSPKYITVFDGLEEVTFMYHEEWIMYNRCIQNNLLLLYDNQIEVIHIGNASTKKAGKTSRDSRKLRYNRVIQSSKNILEYINRQPEARC